MRYHTTIFFISYNHQFILNFILKPSDIFYMTRYASVNKYDSRTANSNAFMYKFIDEKILCALGNDGHSRWIIILFNTKWEIFQPYQLRCNMMTTFLFCYILLRWLTHWYCPRHGMDSVEIGYVWCERHFEQHITGGQLY